MDRADPDHVKDPGLETPHLDLEEVAGEGRRCLGGTWDSGRWTWMVFQGLFQLISFFHSVILPYPGNAVEQKSQLCSSRAGEKSRS